MIETLKQLADRPGDCRIGEIGSNAWVQCYAFPVDVQQTVKGVSELFFEVGEQGPETCPGRSS